MWDQFINNRMRDVETNQSFAYMMATQKILLGNMTLHQVNS